MHKIRYVVETIEYVKKVRYEHIEIEVEMRSDEDIKKFNRLKSKSTQGKF